MTPKGPIVAIDHVYYRTRDMDRAVAFYETILGLAVSSRAGNEWAEFRAEGVRLALHGTEEARRRRAGPSSSASRTSMRPDGLSSNEASCSTDMSPRFLGSRDSRRSTIPTGTSCS